VGAGALKLPWKPLFVHTIRVFREVRTYINVEHEVTIGFVSTSQRRTKKWDASIANLELPNNRRNWFIHGK